MSAGTLPPPSSPLGPRDGAARAVLTLVPDTNALVRAGGASLRELLERFRPTPRGQRPRCHPAQGGAGAGPTRSAGATDGVGRASVRAPQARKATTRRRAGIRGAQGTAIEGGVRDPVAVGTPVGPTPTARDARRAHGAPRVGMRLAVRQRARGGRPGDEEIVFFARARRRRGEPSSPAHRGRRAAVTARLHSSEDDVPRRARRPSTRTTRRWTRTLCPRRRPSPTAGDVATIPSKSDGSIGRRRATTTPESAPLTSTRRLATRDGTPRRDPHHHHAPVVTLRHRRARRVASRRAVFAPPTSARSVLTPAVCVLRS